MSGIAITFSIVGLMVVLFVSNRVPVAVVALGAALLLYATGVLEQSQALSGFGDTTVLFIASLFVVSASLEASGVTAWVGRLLIHHAGESRTRLLAWTMLLGGVLTALIGVSGAVAALLPVVILVAVQLRRAPSQLLLPLAFAAHAGSMLVLTGSLVNVLLSDAAMGAGLPAFGYFELTVIGVPLLAGTIAIVVLLGPALLPMRMGRMIPEDLSKHARTLADQYQLAEGLVRLEVTPGSPYVGRARGDLDLQSEPGLGLIAVQPRDVGRAILRPTLASGDVLLLRGDADSIERLAKKQRLAQIEGGTAADIRASLFNSTSGFVEAVIPPRSGLIGQSMFPGMITANGVLIVLAIQRRGEVLGPGEVVLEAGDTLLLQGGWQALDELQHDPDVLVVDSPDLMRRQAGTLGAGAKRAIAVLAVMVLLLATGAVPTVVAGLVAAIAMILLRVLRIEEAYRAINGTALIMIASLIPLSTAMYQSGAAGLMADALVGLVGERSPYKLLAALFVLTAFLGQLISSTATALILIPIAISAATEIGVSPRTALVTVAVAAAASFLTPVASGANLMVLGPGGYRFGDYWRLGLPLMLWFLLVATFLVPVFWPF